MHRVVSQGYVFELPRAGKFIPDKAKALGVPTNQWRFLQKGESIQLGEQTILPEMVMGPKRKGLKVVFSGDTAACMSSCVRYQCGQFKQFGSMTNFEIMVIKNFYSVST